VSYVRFLGPPRISATAEAGHSGACNVCGAFDTAFAKLLWPLVWRFYRRNFDFDPMTLVYELKDSVRKI